MMVLKILQMIIVILKNLMIIFNGYIQNTSLYKCHLYNRSYYFPFSSGSELAVKSQLILYRIAGRTIQIQFAPPIHGFRIHELNQLWTGNCIFNPWLGIRRC